MKKIVLLILLFITSLSYAQSSRDEMDNIYKIRTCYKNGSFILTNDVQNDSIYYYVVYSYDKNKEYFISFSKEQKKISLRPLGQTIMIYKKGSKKYKITFSYGKNTKDCDSNKKPSKGEN